MPRLMGGKNNPARFQSLGDTKMASHCELEASGVTVKAPSGEFQGLDAATKEIVDAHLTGYPVKLGSLAKALGIRVLRATLPRGISGEIRQEDGDFVIRVNRHEAKHRQRFTLAHEIAHFLLHRHQIIEDGGWSENVLLRSGQPAQVEFEANRLASDLILPSNLVENAVKEYSGPLVDEVIEDLARKFGVSITAMEIKLQMS